MKEIVEIACGGASLAVNKETLKPISCSSDNCIICKFCADNGCDDNELSKWAESEYIEKPVPVISKRDRAFLDYLDAGIHYIARDMDGGLFVYISKPHKLIDCWESSGCESDKSLKFFKLDFPMVKWEDDSPWLIEDLEKLEVVEEYEKK